MECGKMKMNKSERKTRWQTKPGQPKFEPTDEQRGWVSAMAGVRMTHEEMSRIIVNPHTGHYICCETLVKAFPDELAGGKARLKHRLCTKLVERIDAGDWNAIQFGFQHVYGWKDKDANGEDDGYSRLPLDQLVETLAAQAKALGLHIDLSYKFHEPGRFGGVKDPKLIEGVVKRSEEKKR